MTPNEYLNEILEDQTLSQDDEELDDLRSERSEVENLLRGEYGSTPSIRYGGSYAKKTMIRTSFDLDILCYFPREDDSAGDTLKEIYDDVADALRDDYLVEPKRSALRLLDPDSEHYAHVDVVPGRFVEGSDGDVNLHQEVGQKESLKTNPEKHLEHIRESGVRDAIKLAKFWREKKSLEVKTFILELLVVEVLEGEQDSSLEDQMVQFFETLRDDIENISVEDPANREGNDLSDMFGPTVRTTLSGAASRSLSHVENDNWEAVFGPIEEEEVNERAEKLKSTSAAATGSSKPWYHD